MGQADEHIDTFLSAVDRVPKTWAAIDVRCIALLSDGRWHNLLTRCRLDTRVPDAIPRVPHLPVTSMLACHQMVMPIGELETFLLSIRNGAADIAETNVAFTQRDSQGSAPIPYSGRFSWVAAQSRWQQDFEPYPSAHRLVLNGDSQGELFRRADTDREKLDALVTSLEHPWDGLDSLTHYGLGTTSRIDHSTQTQAEFLAPLEAELVRCELRQGRIQYVVKAATRTIAKQCTIGVFAVQPGGGIVSKTTKPPASSWSTMEGGTHQVTHSLRVAEALHATLLLRIGSFVVDRQTAHDTTKLGKNARVVAYSQFDGGLERLSAILQDPKRAKNEDEFHSVVARLFTFAGFFVDSFVADESLTGKGIPDLLAHAPNQGWLLIVECTTGSLSPRRDKLSLLVTRARHLREALARGSAEKVLPVIVTSLAELPQHEMEAARRSRVAVLTQADLRQLLQLGQDQVPLQAVINWCHGKVPTRDPLKLA